MFILFQTNFVICFFFVSEWQSAAAKLSATEEKSNELGTKLKNFIEINIGPWDRLTLENSTKMGIAEQPKTANFYPKNMFETLKKEDEKKSDKDKFATLIETECGGKDNNDITKLANGYFSVLSNKNGKMEVIPYRQEYGAYVLKASEHLKKAANYLKEDESDLSKNKHQSLIGFLEKRSEHFLDDNYGESDALWIQVQDSLFDVTIGPYEVYEDHILAKKAAFESFLCLKLSCFQSVVFFFCLFAKNISLH